MVSALISRIVILVFGTLYPAYASYKAVRTKNVREYVKWMMYWIVFALFTCVETFSDVLLSWLPFYYEVKIVFVVWMLSPMTKGSSFLFKKFVHPHLARREKSIDEMISQARNQSYTTLLTLGTRGLAYASQMVVKTALMGQSKLVDHLRRSYSTSDLSNDGSHVLQRHEPVDEEGDDELDNRLREDQAELKSKGTRLTRSSSSASTGLHSVKEEEEEEEEVVTITEEFVYPVTTYYSPKDGEDSGLSTRSSSGISTRSSSSSSLRSSSSSTATQSRPTPPSRPCRSETFSTPPSSPSGHSSSSGGGGGGREGGGSRNTRLSRSRSLTGTSGSGSATSALDRHRHSSSSLYSASSVSSSSSLYSSSSSLSQHHGGTGSSTWTSLGSLSSATSSTRQRRLNSSLSGSRPRSTKF